MEAYDSLKKQLLPTGLYTLDGTTMVDFELKAYAAGINPAYNELTELQTERFPATAADYGLASAERAYGLTGTGSLEMRRAVVLALSAVSPNSVTVSDLETILSAFGLSVTVAEDAAGKKITAKFQSEPACGRDAAQTLLEKFCPAHLTAESDYTNLH